jgi:hypothetical protein
MDAMTEECLAILDEKDKNNETGNLKDFVYDLASIGFSPKGFGSGHANGYQAYGRWVANAIQGQIDVYGAVAAAEFQEAIDNETATLNALLQSEKASLHADNQNKQDSLNRTGARLLAEITAERERLQVSLDMWQNAQEAADEEQRDLDQIALVSTKNDLWKDLSWIVRKTHAGYGYGQGGFGGHEHGLSAGPVYGYINAFAQSSGTGGPVPQDGDYREPYGWGAEGAEDGYNPFGYGDWGFGYGYQQSQYKEVQSKLDAMAAAQAATWQQNEDRIAASQKGLNAAQSESWDQWSDHLAARWAEWEAAVVASDAWWAQTVYERTAIVDAGIAAAADAIATALRTKLDEFDRMEKEIRWHITSIYNYDVQHELNEGLTAARASRDAECTARQVAFAAYLVDVKNTWEACVESETADFNANTASATATLQAGKDLQIQIFADFKDYQQDRFQAWAENERAELRAFIDDCEAAW